MIKVNLVPSEILGKARQRQLVLQAAVLGTLLGFFLVGACFFHWFGLYRLQQDFVYKESKLKKLDAIVKQVEELEKAAAAVRARLGVIEDLLKGRAFYPTFMSEFVRTVPPGVQVLSLNTTASGPGTVKLAISGKAATGDDIAAWVRTLEKTPHFKNVELGPVTTSGAHSYTFTVSGVYSSKL